MAYLGEGSVVPQVALVWETVADIAKLALFDVLLDGIECFLFGDLLKLGILDTLTGSEDCEPPSSHWSSEEPQQSCSEQSDSHWRRGECRGMKTPACHPSR